MTFLDISFLDILDIFVVAYILYQFYLLIKGTVAINIFLGILFIYLIWSLVKALNMQLLGSILGQVMGVGVIALIIVFQQEIRRFLLIIGTRYFANRNFSLENFFSLFQKRKSHSTVRIYSIVKACINMAKDKTGALIVIGSKSGLDAFSETGVIIDANTSSVLLENIFFKNSPMHDGAVIIVNEKIYAAKCILPVSENPELPENVGFRHRAAVGISEITDSHVVVVSEERGQISYVHSGVLQSNLTIMELRHLLEAEFKHPET